MALTIPSFPNPNSKTRPLIDAYAWVAGLYLDISQDQGRIVLNVHPSEEDYMEPPVAQVAISLGQEVVKADPEHNTPAVSVATLEALMSDTNPVGNTGVTFAQAYSVIGMKLYQESLKHPAFKDATVVL